MPTNKPVVAIILDEETIKRIEDFQFNNRFRNRSSAVVYILRAGMKALAADHPELDLGIKLETGKKAQVDGVISENEERVHI